MSPSSGPPPRFLQERSEEEQVGSVPVVNDSASGLLAFLTDHHYVAKDDNCSRNSEDMIKEKERRRDSLIGLIHRLKVCTLRRLFVRLQNSMFLENRRSV